METPILQSVIAFEGTRRLASGPLPEVARAVRIRLDEDPTSVVLVFDDQTSAPVDLDLRGTPDEVAARVVAESTAAPAAGEASRGPGRPRLGVVSREVSLLPRHWAWLSDQPGGASAAIRRLVEDARRATEAADRARHARDAVYRFMHVVAGDLPGFEEASRALFAGRLDDLRAIAAPWPEDVRAHLVRLADRIGQNGPS